MQLVCVGAYMYHPTNPASLGTKSTFKFKCELVTAYSMPLRNAVHIPLPIQIVRSTSCMSRETHTNSTKIDTHTSCMSRLMLYITTIPSPPSTKIMVQRSNSLYLEPPPGLRLAKAINCSVKRRSVGLRSVSSVGDP